VDGGEFQATTNLESALRHLRSDRTKVLWVDAVCINQRNIDEKNSQVRRMGEIFAKASNVIVWLGEADKTTALAFATLERLASLNESLIVVYRGDHESNLSEASLIKKRLGGSASANISTYVRKLFRQPPCALTHGHVHLEQFLGRRAQQGLVHLCQRPWWGRLWVKQEFLLSHSSSFVCGRSAMAAELALKGLISLMILWEMATSKEMHASPFAADGGYYLHKIVSLLELCPPSGLDPDARRLLFLLHSLVGNCTDPRDRIFAILSLASDEFVDLNKPDYGLRFEQVYLRLSKTWITSQNDLDVLSCCRLLVDVDFSIRLPSWVPDWRFYPSDSLLRESFKTGSRTFHANLSSSVDYEFSESGESDILLLGGCRVGVIDQLGDELSDKVDLEKPTDFPLNRWQLLAQNVSADPVVFWLTCIQEVHFCKRLDPQRRQEFRHCIQNWTLSQTEELPIFDSRPLYQYLYISYNRRFFLSGTTKMGISPPSAQVVT
jgi:Heterokaryon incompatibility protein (HET)